ncbi:MAG: riboflavin biosynthesis protein RibF [Candidatus Omnitrophica bacterium]|nr:riboflavin biosynthesis protein RibF [Candidatus Omnitrophota bacterium]
MPSKRVLKGLNAVASPPTRAVVTVGVFDGVHIAHQRLIRSTIQLAQRLDGTSVAITFDPDPQIVLDPAHAQPALMPLEVRVATLQALGLDWVWILPFTTRFARMTAEQFIRRILVHRLRATALVIGEAFVFGKNRRGDMDVLRRLGPWYGIRVVPVRQVRRLGAPVSSSRIRRLIGLGELAQARGLLGRPPALYGVVVPGTGRGRRLGFPTANIRLIPQVVPLRGVYAVTVRLAPPPIRGRGTRTAAATPLASGELIGGGVMNLGVRPTFGPGPMICEVHLLGFAGTLLGRSVSLSLLARLRDERCFPSWQALSQQVRRDIARARRLFARLPRLLRS